MSTRSLARFAAPLIALCLLAAACGDDSAATKKADTTELCKLVNAMDEQDGLPSAAQIEKYNDLAPAEIKDASDTASPPIIAADGDPVKFFTGIADDDVEAAIHEIDAFEAKECGAERDPVPSKEATSLDPAATRVDVTASEYTFAFDTAVPTGRTSFVLTSTGKEAHFMALSRIADGHTLDEALAYDGDPADAGLVTNPVPSSNIAAPGGADEEVLTVDLTAGSWAMLCFIGGPDGTPHAFMGMAVPFTVS